MISAVIPTLNAGAALAAALGSLPRGLVAEVIVSDGGSADDTLDVAARQGAVVVEGPAGRGAQMVRGAEVARGDWLLFLHADTTLSEGAKNEINEFMSGPANAGKAAVFRFTLDDRGVKACLLEVLVRVRCRVLALPYGDQGLLISRALYEAVGGFRPLALMEDVDMVHRIGRARLHYFKSAAITSAERYRRDGYLRRMVRNACCLGAYFLGVAPARLREFYER